MAEVDKTLVPDLERLVSNVRFAFVNFLRQQTTTSEQVREQVLAFLKNILTKMEARRTFTGAYAALAFGFPERYMDAIWARKSYIHFELTKVQRLKLGKDDTVSMIQATLLLKPVVNLVTAGASVAGHETASGIVQSQFAEKVFAVAKRQLPLVPGPGGQERCQLQRLVHREPLHRSDRRGSPAYSALALETTSRACALTVGRTVRTRAGSALPDGTTISMDLTLRSWTSSIP